MPATTSEADELAAALDKLELTDLQQQALKARFIACIKWLERAATRNRRGHYAMRLTATTGGVVVTSMSWNISSTKRRAAM